MPSEKFDIIVFGATSFVGQILARYMKEQFSSSDLTWAIAGRSESKLATLKSALNTPELPTIVADAADDAALRAMCAQANVVVSTVGPYALYGEPLVKVCVETGTHYCDLTGEPHWIRQMQDKYESAAKQSGAWIVHCCGFDSIPSDLGVHYLQSHAKENYGTTFSEIKMRVAKMRGGASGGTIASMVNIVKEMKADKALRRIMVDPYALCPPEHGFSARQHNIKMEYDDKAKSWLAPFVMAAINTRVVHRSNALSGNAYGTNFQYEEAMMTGDGNRGKSMARKMVWGMGAFMMGISVAPLRWVLERFVLSKPGEGPTPEQQQKGNYTLLFRGTTEDGQSVVARVTGDRDPGYGSTGKMLGQAAACLARDVDAATPGGFWTPATIMGDTLLQRLEADAGLTFSIDS